MENDLLKDDLDRVDEDGVEVTITRPKDADGNDADIDFDSLDPEIQKYYEIAVWNPNKYHLFVDGQLVFRGNGERAYEKLEKVTSRKHHVFLIAPQDPLLLDLIERNKREIEVANRDKDFRTLVSETRDRIRKKQKLQSTKGRKF